jgi:hypothetical protein
VHGRIPPSAQGRKGHAEARDKRGRRDSAWKQLKPLGIRAERRRTAHCTRNGTRDRWRKACGSGAGICERFPTLIALHMMGRKGAGMRAVVA